ncbi:NAD-dependent epimerase/dehydratase family protein [Cryptosporangium aurantiacum]|uniref:NAD-dependent epimerase/dehydratase family protein n=1 Tax=Cryptosporangium aurantiacum TaxID=134849 RepID=UPI0009332E7B|nr:NAD-dependent epimerase/dehydratase family protein [Cryptosporangium aurantiacum]
MRVLVTGGTGYVGSAVVRALLADGHDVTVLTRGEATVPDVTTVRGTLAAPPLDGIDAVCHLAALTQARESLTDPDRYHRVNALDTAALLDALRGRPVVFASTSAVYGVPERQPITEDAPLAPLNPYGATKMAAEQAVSRYVGPATILRIFNAAGAVAGRGDHDRTRLVPKAVAVAAGLEPALRVNGDGSAVRDFVHVADVADAFVRALRGPTGVYNLGGVAAAVADVVAATERVTGRPVALEHHPANPGEAPSLYADTSRARAALGWDPYRSTLDEIVASQWDAVRPGAIAGR